MYPAWGGYGGGGPQPQHFCPRTQPFRGPPPPAGGFGGYGAPSPAAASNFSSLHEQHLQQMQQLQQLHQRQLQSVLHYNNNANNANSAASSFSAAPGPAAPQQWTGPAAGFPPAHFTPDPAPNRGAAQPEPPSAPPPAAKTSPSTPTHTSNTTTNTHTTTSTADSPAAEPKEKTTDLSTMSLQARTSFTTTSDHSESTLDHSQSSLTLGLTENSHVHGLNVQHQPLYSTFLHPWFYSALNPFYITVQVD